MNTSRDGAAASFLANVCKGPHHPHREEFLLNIQYINLPFYFKAILPCPVHICSIYKFKLESEFVNLKDEWSSELFANDWRSWNFSWLTRKPGNISLNGIFQTVLLERWCRWLQNMRKGKKLLLWSLFITTSFFFKTIIGEDWGRRSGISLVYLELMKCRSSW